MSLRVRGFTTSPTDMDRLGQPISWISVKYAIPGWSGGLTLAVSRTVAASPGFKVRLAGTLTKFPPETWFPSLSVHSAGFKVTFAARAWLFSMRIEATRTSPAFAIHLISVDRHAEPVLF